MGIELALAGLLLYGFLCFVNTVQALHEPVTREGMEPADAIVVLTGGSERVRAGVALLEAGQGKKLFISGVHKKFKLDDVVNAKSLSPEQRACCIALGYRAESTLGNAEETRTWMREQGYGSLRLVTANYHMPRSLLLFHDAMPEIAIDPFPVEPDSVKLDAWWRHPGTVHLLATEYVKYLVASIPHSLKKDSP